MSSISPPRAPSTVHDCGLFIQDGLDIDTAALIAQLALEDLEEVFQGRKGKSRADSPLSDEECAFQVQYEHYKQLLAIAEDAKLARSIGDAVAADAAFLEASITAEAAAEADRRAAEMLSRGEILPAPNATQARLEDPTFIMHPEPPTIVAGPSVNRNRSVDCTICNDRIRYTNSLQTPCNHYYCRDCVTSLIEAFTKDESLFPLRCCQEPIPISDVIPFISLNLRKLFETKQTEFSVLSKDRIYCVSPTCSKFLGSSVGITGWSIICPQCSTSTCPRCKQASHEGEDCVVNAATVELRALARREGWQTCPGCHILVELNVGCYHMTCRCRAQFCYLCAVPWKNCQCPQWEEARLVAAAQQRVENEIGARAVRNAVPEVLAEQIRHVAENLRVNHHCERHTWRYRPGGGRCEECNFNLAQYLLICTGCSILACVRCSRNRF
ncbi:hypothetical protein GALMADRAFT_266649 [Galerina marginata CBS 339.88]|uniref:RBR-type E3 ubiquitin transferase n=1 Tax=Galerina marginata (strain CBS 339.88) TaxID=685588 RepID=A0A067TGK9_GALM3|nr:hypothetical protein GALMADRAFT_266649 [Galerina marginata CBS 339.88]